MSARWLLMQSIKSRRKRYEACDDAVGLDLPCAAGHLGLQSAHSALLRALGFVPQSVIIRINSITRKG